MPLQAELISPQTADDRHNCAGFPGSLLNPGTDSSFPGTDVFREECRDTGRRRECRHPGGH